MNICDSSYFLISSTLFFTYSILASIWFESYCPIAIAIDSFTSSNSIECLVGENIFLEICYVWIWVELIEDFIVARFCMIYEMRVSSYDRSL